MIEKFSIWTKNLTLAIVVVSIIEMLLPNNKNKKYIKVVIGIYILFNIISPFINEKTKIDIGQILENTKTTSQIQERVDQTSMNDKLEKMCKEELEKDITKKIQNLGYKVNECKVKLEIKDIKETKNTEKTSNIKQIYLDVEKEKENENVIENKEEKKNDDEINEVKIENKIVEEVEKIKKVQIGKNINKEKENKNNEKNNSNNDINKRITKLDIQKIKKYLIKEYEVKETCLKIN